MTYLSNELRKSLVLINNHLEQIMESVSIITLEITEVQHGQLDTKNKLDKMAGKQSSGELNS